MPILRTKTTYERRDRERAATDPRTAVFVASNEQVPAYKPALQPRNDIFRGRLLQPTSDRDLEYFYAVAAGLVPSHERASEETLVLYLSRATQKHILPIAEHMSLGPSMGTPFYSIHATPGSSTITEYNTLILARRSSQGPTSKECCICEIEPRINIFAPGVMQIARITRGMDAFSLSWGDRQTAGPIGECWTLWSAKSGEPVVHYVEDEGWESLDDPPGSGIIRMKLPCKYASAADFGQLRFQDPRTVADDLAYLDFTKQYPQFVSRNNFAHEILDILVAGLFTVLTVATRRTCQARAGMNVAGSFCNRTTPTEYRNIEQIPVTPYPGTFGIFR